MTWHWSQHQLIPEFCIKIIEKLEKYLITKGYDILGSKEKYRIGIKDDGRFYLNNFHPLGVPEALILSR